MTTVSVPCAGCGNPILLNDEVDATLRRTGSTFYCHAGCPNYYPVKRDPGLGAIERQKNEERLQRLVEENAALWRALRKARLEDAARIREARKVARTCPLCQEVFPHRSRVGHHIETQHARSALRADGTIAVRS